MKLLKLLDNLFYLLFSPIKLIVFYYTIKGFLNNPGINLDIGSGNSFFKRLCSFFGVKVFSANIEVRDEIDIVFDAHYISIRNNSVSNISNFSVIEHLEFPEKFLKESRRILKASGSFFLFLPFIYGEHDSIDFQRYTEVKLSKILSSTGFKKHQIIRLGGTLTSINNILINYIHSKFRNKYGWNIKASSTFISSILAKFVTLPFYLISWPLFFMDLILDRNSSNCTFFLVICKI